jgi:glycosyltransferase involved in cell wall biosynthesis
MSYEKIRIAFVKFSGMAAGGSEKFLQVIAANLPKERFLVDYYYCDAAPYIGAEYQVMNTDPSRVEYMQKHGVNLIKFSVKAKDITTPLHKWVDTDFFKKFNERNYDIVQTARSGHKEYPFYKIRKTPIVDSIHLDAGVDNQFNISRVMHLCNWSARRWVRRGGDSNRVVIVSHPISVPSGNVGDLRNDLNLSDKFIYGMHQRPHDSIFSPIPLNAYKRIETPETAFVMLGGGELYKKQAKDLGIQNIRFLKATGEMDKVYKFLKTLNVYAHGRKDGEINSQAMAEAMYCGLPIVSHTSNINNGHVECVGDAGKVVSREDEYKEELLKLKEDPSYYKLRSKAAEHRFNTNYQFSRQIKHFVEIYEDVIKNPFPRKLKRILSGLHYTQNIRLALAFIYLKLKYKLNIDLKR